MQINLDLDAIIGDEEIAKAEIFERAATQLVSALHDDAAAKMAKMMDAYIAASVNSQIEEVVQLALDTEYQKVGKFGKLGDKTTIRDEVAKAVQDQCEYKRATFRSDENIFTQAVDALVRAEVRKFKDQFNSTITKKVVAECLDTATKTLRKACGLEPAKKGLE